MIPIFSVVEEIPKFFYQDRGSKKKNDFGTITATYVNECWNLDILDLTEKFKRYNSNYRYIYWFFSLYFIRRKLE